MAYTSYSSKFFSDVVDRAYAVDRSTVTIE